MFHKGKYVVGRMRGATMSTDKPFALVFPETVVHAEIARRVFVPDTVIAAGFFVVTGERVRQYGRSESLNVGSRQEDQALLEQALGLAE